MPNIKKVAIMTSAVVLAQAILSKLVYPLIGKSTQTLFAISDIQPASGIGGQQVGNKVLGFVSGYIPFDIASFSSWIILFIGAFAIMYAGFWLYEQRHVKLWQGKDLTQRLIAILLYGHVALFGLLYLLNMSVPGIAINLLIGLLINLAAVSFVITMSSKYLKWPKI